VPRRLGTLVVGSLQRLQLLRRDRRARPLVGVVQIELRYTEHARNTDPRCLETNTADFLVQLFVENRRILMPLSLLDHAYAR